MNSSFYGTTFVSKFLVHDGVFFWEIIIVQSDLGKQKSILYSMLDTYLHVCYYPQSMDNNVSEQVSIGLKVHRGYYRLQADTNKCIDPNIDFTNIIP